MSARYKMEYRAGYWDKTSTIKRKKRRKGGGGISLSFRSNNFGPLQLLLAFYTY